MKIYLKGHVFTASEIHSLAVGDVLENCFGKLQPVTKITGRGEQYKTKCAFVAFHQQFGETSTMSNAIREGEAVLIVGGRS